MGINLTLVPEIRTESGWTPAIPFKRNVVIGPCLDHEALSLYNTSAKYDLLYYILGFSGDEEIPVVDNLSSTPPSDTHPDILWWQRNIVTEGYYRWCPLKSFVDYLWDEPYVGTEFREDFPENKDKPPLCKLRLGFHGYTAEYFVREKLPRLQALGKVEDVRVHAFFM